MRYYEGYSSYTNLGQILAISYPLTVNTHTHYDTLLWQRVGDKALPA